MSPIRITFYHDNTHRTLTVHIMFDIPHKCCDRLRNETKYIQNKALYPTSLLHHMKYRIMLLKSVQK